MNSKQSGRLGEEKAALFLQNKGFKIIAQNYRFGKKGEIDLIAKIDNLLIFIEVKSRKSTLFGGPLYSLNNRKKNTIKYIASRFLTENPEYFSKTILCRFDMISIINGKIQWIQDIFR